MKNRSLYFEVLCSPQSVLIPWMGNFDIFALDIFFEEKGLKIFLPMKLWRLKIFNQS